ncbi:hypothetical protein GCM10022402_13150 [Salinactinospora qingdaonensis]|uniref:AMP-dependent synthetase/ligase domain-containing protein n=2 Tax=Salinactinospora qingdaonensis TaxID=702744 RepID=A0ABP7FAN1_9ACTN
MQSTGRKLLSWINSPSEKHGIRFTADRRSWDFWSYQRLSDLSHRVAAGLVANGVSAGDVVSIVERSSPHFVATLFGTMLAGATPSPIAPPMTFGDQETYAEHVAGLLTVSQPALVVTDSDLAAPTSELTGRLGLRPPVPVTELADTPGSVPDRPLAPAALLQFTSGSSGRARGVRVPYRALESNVEAIRRWLRMTEEDVTASWLPVHHDMGLIGCLITPMVNRSEIWLMQPEDFIRDPARFLRCFGEDGARLTAMPTFGLRYATRRVRPKALANCDFSEWRAVIVGAERISPEALDGFTELLAPYGFRRRALLPAYGLAEATLAATGLPLAEEWRGLRVDPTSVELGGIVGEDSSGRQLAGCGRPVDGVTVRILGPDDTPLPEGHVGEIELCGDSVAEGYASVESSDSLTCLSDGVLRTGDAGFLSDGQLFVLGRLGDALKIRGRSLFAEDLEVALNTTVNVPEERMAVVLGERGGTPTAVAVMERAQPDWLTGAEPLLRQLTEGADVAVIDAPPGTIPRTSSGKPKRRSLWRSFLHGDLPEAAPPQTASAAPATTGGSDD